jgi:LCP family protein required for cell wall assembly
VVVVCLVAMGSAYGYVRYRIDKIATAPSHDVTKPTGPVTDGLTAENILLIGNETRQGLTPAQQLQYGSSLSYSGSLADIMMVLHLDPVTGKASILSIPRDLFAPMPADSPVGPYQKLDAALNDGVEGPDNLVTAIQDDLGIPINHFVEINFNGFINSVNALGGINVYFPEPVWDAESLLYIATPGCHHLNGVSALALVRARHLQYDPPGDHEAKYYWPQEAQSDLARIVRTHTFMKVVAETARSKGLTDILQANAFITAILGQMTVDQGLKDQLTTLVERYHGLNPGDIPETTFPVAIVDSNGYYYDYASIGDVEFPVQPKDDNVIRAWDPQALPAPVAPSAVHVVSITGSYDAALLAGQRLSKGGLHVTSESVGAVPASTTETLVLYHKGQRAEALDVMGHLSGAVMMQLDPSLPAGTVEVDLGSVVAVKVASAKSTASKGRTTTTTVPTPQGEPASPAADVNEPWDPRAC